MQDGAEGHESARHRGSRWVLAALLGLGSGFQTQAAHAQEVRSDFSGASEEALFAEVPHVTGASRYEQDPREAPASISVVTQEDIRRFGYRTLGDVLNSVPGFFTLLTTATTPTWPSGASLSQATTTPGY